MRNFNYKDNKDYKDIIGLASVDFFKNDTTLKVLDSIGFKAIIFYTPHSVIKGLKKVHFQECSSSSCTYIEKNLDLLKKHNQNCPVYLKSFVKLSTPCFFTFSDIRAFK